MSRDAKKGKTPDHCKNCVRFSRSGISRGGYDRWCCYYGKPAVKAVGVCKNQGTKIVREGPTNDA